jgi:hypothetical protein
MTRFLPIILLGSICWAGGINSRAETTNAPGKDFASFRIITERNIFNPNRTALGRPAYSDAPKRVVTDRFGLLGTMIYEKGRFAFFGGTRSDFKKVVSPSDKIAGYTVTQIEPNLVKLQTNGQSLELKVGQQLKRPEGGEWTLSTTEEPFDADSTNSSSGESNRENRGSSEYGSSRNSRSRWNGESSSSSGNSRASSSSNGSSNSGSAGNESDILKRLLQKREQELKK